MSIATASKRGLRLLALVSALGLGSNVAAQSFSVSPNSSGGSPVTLTGLAGGTTQQAFAITNNTPLAMNVFGALTGAGSSSFNLPGLGMVSVAGGATDTFEVNYAPTTTGVKNAVLRLYNGIDSVLVNLQGTASSAFNLITGSLPGVPVNLNAPVGSTASAVFSVINRNSTPITLNGSFSGAGGSSFSLPGGNSITVGANDTADFTVQFAPNTTGVQNATLAIANGVDSQFVSLVGTATGAINTVMLTANNTLVEFNNAIAGVEQCQTVTYTNNTDAAATITGRSIIGLSGGGNQFDVDEDASGSTTVAPGASTTVVVCYTPVASGENVVANLKVQYRGTDSTNNGVTMVRLEGSSESGGSDSLDLNVPRNVDFDARPGEIECQTVRIVNLGGLQTVLGGTLTFSLSDTNAGFDVQGGNTATLDPTGNGSVTVCFTGDSNRLFSQSVLNILATGAGNTFLGSYNVRLTGETEYEIDEDITDTIFNAARCFRVRQNQPLLGPIVRGGSTSEQVTVTNNTNQTATITGGSFSSQGGTTQSGAFSLAQGTTFPVTIPAFGSSTFNVNFTPTDSQLVRYDATLALDVQGTACNDININLGAVAIPGNNAGGNGVLDTLNLIGGGGFGGNTVAVSGACDNAPQTVAFQNNLATAVTVTGLNFSGSSNANFTVLGSTPTLPATLQAGEIMQIQVQFNCDQTPGFTTGTLQIQTQGGVQPQTVVFQTFQQQAASVNRAQNGAVEISVSPNPTRGMVRIEVKDAVSAQIDVLTIMGDVVASTNATSWTWNGQIDGSNASTGTYIVRVTGMNHKGEQFVESRQIVVQH